MAGIASHLLEFPPSGNPSPGQYDTRIRAFVESLAKVDPGKIVKADQQQDFLQILDPQINSLAYLWVLSLRVKVFYQSKDQTQEQARSLLLQMSSFMQQFDSVQIRYVGNMLRETIEAALILAANLQQLSIVVNPLVAAIFRIDPTSGTLTSTHLKLLRICLRQRLYREALPILESTIHSFPSPRALQIDGQYLCSPHKDSSAYITEVSGFSEKLAAIDVHEFFLLGGMVYIALQQWEDAKLYLECVLISPSQGLPSVLQVEAYKKWVLVTCILKGTVPDPPKATNLNMLRTIRSITKAYDQVADIFQSGNALRLQAEVAAGQQVWFDDGNLGLIQLLLTRIPRFEILSMQNTYSAIPLSTASNWLNISVDELHALVEEMVGEKALNADIDLTGNEPVLRFYSNQSKGPLAKTEKEYHAELITQTKRTNAMADYVKMSDRRLTLTKEYIEALRKRARNKDENGGVVIGNDGLDDPSQIDEDIMMDE